MDEKELLEAKILAIANGSSKNALLELAELANDVYDAELPVPDVVSAVFKTASVERGVDYDYFTVLPTEKTVLSAVDGAVTQLNVTPRAHQSLVFSPLSTQEEYVYVDKLLEAKYDPIAKISEDHQEAMNRKEVKMVCDLLIAGATPSTGWAGNQHELESGSEVVTFKKLVEMVRSVAKYGTKCVAIAGANVYTDLILMDSEEDKNRELTPAKAGISAVYPVEAFTFVGDGGSEVVLDADTLIVVAVSDSKANKPGHFVRRKVRSIDGASDKERVIMVTGPLMNVATNRKWAYATACFEQIGAVLVNKFCVATLEK